MGAPYGSSHMPFEFSNRHTGDEYTKLGRDIGEPGEPLQARRSEVSSATFMGLVRIDADKGRGRATSAATALDNRCYVN